MKIAVPTENKYDLFKRTGQAPGFIIVEVRDNRMFAEEYLPMGEIDDEATEALEHSHPGITKKLSGVDYILVNAIGKYLQEDMEKNDVEVVRTKETNIEKAVKRFLDIN